MDTAVLNKSISGELTKIQPNLNQVGVIGGGAWGTALAAHVARMGHDTVLWAIEKDVVDDVNTAHENKRYLAGIPLPPSLKADNDLRAVITHGELIIMVVPTPFVAKTLSPVADAFTPDKIMVSCTKGINTETLETVNQVLTRVMAPAFHARLAYLSGPSFAKEVAMDPPMPTAVTVASHTLQTAQRVQQLMSTTRFRCYTSLDVVGVELGGALKNVLAIACGVCDGAGFGNNGRAALITRGLDEITRLAVALGANPLTLAGLAGVGDTVLTCVGDLSRNRTVGLRIGKGEKLADITSSMGGAVAEGVLTSKAAYDLMNKVGVDCPLLRGIYKVVHEGADPAREVVASMSRDLKSEIDERVLKAATSHAAM